MADTPAERKRRQRAHAKGDHSTCVAGRCEALGGASRTTPPEIVTIPRGGADVTPSPAARADVTPPTGAPGRIEQLVRDFVKTLPYGPADPRSLVAEIAVELAKRVDETGAVPGAIRELRIMLMQLAEAPNGPAGVVDELRVRHHQQQLDALLAVAA